jgi:hypothetical protein
MMKNPRKKSAPTLRSPDGALREASKTLTALGGTLLNVRSRLETAKGWTGMMGRPGMVQTIEKLVFVSDELRATRGKISEARLGIRGLRSPRPRKPKGGRRN